MRGRILFVLLPLVAAGFQHQTFPRCAQTRRHIYFTVSFAGSSRSNRLKSFNLHEGPKRKDDPDTVPTYSESFTNLISNNPTRTLLFSSIMALCGAVLGPILDSYHSAFGVLQYDQPITKILWGTQVNPALITAWWVPILFGVAGWLIGWLYISLDAITETPKELRQPTPPKILIGISLFTLQYWLSGLLVATGIIDGTGILNVMSLYAAIAFLLLDRSLAGFITSAATAIGGPLIELGLILLSRSGLMPGGYHYNDLGVTGFFPLWIVPVYFLGGPAVGNLARGFWSALSAEIGSSQTKKELPPGCKVCSDTRRVLCPNCGGEGRYTAMGGRSVDCTSCKGRGFVICRACFSYYDNVPNDLESIRDFMSRMPD